LETDKPTEFSCPIASPRANFCKGCQSLSYLRFDHLFLGRLLALCEVLFDIELREEYKEHDGVGSDVKTVLPGKAAALDEEQLEAMDHDAHKLYHLQACHVLLPPNVFLKKEGKYSTH
jgi:hypothetical protein